MAPTVVSEYREISAEYIVPDENRPSKQQQPVVSAALQSVILPVIDMQGLDQPTTRQKIVEQIGQACREWGFFQVSNHGLPAELMQSMREETRAFFGLPTWEKKKLNRNEGNAIGYADIEITKSVRNWREVFDVAACGEMHMPATCDPADVTVERHVTRWPEKPAGFRPTCEKYLEATQGLALRLLELICESLGLNPHRLHQYFEGNNTSHIRLNHYDACPQPELVLGVGPHQDSGAVTVLAVDESVEGLEIKSNKDGQWIRVKDVHPSAFIINLGDMLKVWSNDKYEAVEHRVVTNNAKDRISIVFFLKPSHRADVAPLPELVDEENPPRYETINWGRFFKRRIDANYRKPGIVVQQLHHFAINRD